MSVSTPGHRSYSVPGMRADRTASRKAGEPVRTGERSSAKSRTAADVYIQRLFQRLGLRWSQAGLRDKRRVIAAVRPYLGELREADLAAKKASLDARVARGRVTVLEASVAKHRRHRDELAQQVLHANHEASNQKSSSGGAALRRISRGWREELRSYDAVFGDRPRELAAAKSEANGKQIELRIRKRQVSQLEATIRQLLSGVTRPDMAGGRLTSSNRAPRVSLGGATSGGSPRPKSGNPFPHPAEHGPVARVRTEQASDKKQRRSMNDARVRQSGSRSGTSRSENGRDRRR